MIKLYDWLKLVHGNIKLQKDWGELEGVIIILQVGKHWQEIHVFLEIHQYFRVRQDFLFSSNCFTSICSKK